ncbi:MAG: nitrate reductase associated protein [Fibrobacteria bacterium]
MELRIASLFEYEREYRSDLRFIPMAMRYRLDCVGLKIGLPAWQWLPVPARFELAAMPADTGEELTAIRNRLERLLAACPEADAPKRISVDCSGWERRLPVPECVRIGCEALSAPMEASRWLDMETLERYALVKLSLSVKQPGAFRMALEEISARRGRTTAPPALPE